MFLMLCVCARVCALATRPKTIFYQISRLSCRKREPQLHRSAAGSALTACPRLCEPLVFCYSVERTSNFNFCPVQNVIVSRNHEPVGRRRQSVYDVFVPLSGICVVDDCLLSLFCLLFFCSVSYVQFTVNRYRVLRISHVRFLLFVIFFCNNTVN